MTLSYKELLQQQEELALKVEQARRAELSVAVGKVRDIVMEYGLQPSDIFSSRELNRTGGGASTSVASKVTPKYRDPVSGKTWTGRGKPPQWIADKDRAAFAI